MALSVPVEQASAAAERADDYSDTCIGTPIVESLITGCIEVVEQRFREHACTREDVSRFVDGLTMKGPLDDVNFVEQPILFYDIGHGKVVWDYLRHGALIRAFARKTMARQHRLKAGDSSGPGFEKYIAERLSNAIPDIKDLKRNVIIRDRGRKAWEIDVSFVLNEVLFIVEAKH
jgi:hypothetical protein